MNNRQTFHSVATSMVLAYIPIGLSFGLIATQEGLSSAMAVLMSLTIFAATSQVIAVGMMVSGSPIYLIILTTFLINLRHLFMSASLAKSIRDWSTLQKIIFGVHISDETYLVHSTEFRQSKHCQKNAYWINVLSHFSFVVSTFLGTLAVDRFPSRLVGLDFAVPAICLSLMVFQIRDKKSVALALLTGTLTYTFIQIGLQSQAMVLGVILSATLYVWSRTWKTNKFLLLSS